MKSVLSSLGVLILLSVVAAPQGTANPRSAVQIAELIALREKVASPDTRIRVEATHRVWTVGLTTADPEIKLTALQLLAEPVGSSSDHIRMPAMVRRARSEEHTSELQSRPH